MCTYIRLVALCLCMCVCVCGVCWALASCCTLAAPCCAVQSYILMSTPLSICPHARCCPLMRSCVYVPLSLAAKQCLARSGVPRRWIAAGPILHHHRLLWGSVQLAWAFSYRTTQGNTTYAGCTRHGGSCQQHTSSWPWGAKPCGVFLDGGLCPQACPGLPALLVGGGVGQVGLQASSFMRLHVACCYDVAG